MGALQERVEAVKAAAGIKRYVIFGIITVGLFMFDWTAHTLAKFGMQGLIGIPSWAVAILVGMALIAWWLLEDNVRLRRRLVPKLKILFSPDEGGCLVITPLKIKDSITSELIEEYQAISIRGKVTTTSEIAIERCSAFLVGVSKKDKASGQFLPTQYVNDLWLPWNQAEGAEIRVPAGVRRYFEIVWADEKSNKLNLSGPWPLTLRHLFDEFTTYRLDLAVEAEGITQFMGIEIDWDGRWDGIKARSVAKS